MPTNETVLEALHHIPLQIAECKRRTQTILEELHKSCLVEIVGLLTREQCAKKVDQISLSYCTVKESISELCDDIVDHVMAEMKVNPSVALQLDESTNVASCEQSLSTLST